GLEQSRDLGSFFAPRAHHPIDGFRFGLALEKHSVDFTDDHVFPNELRGGMVDENVGAVGFVGAFEPRGDVHGVAHHGVVHGHFRADIADEHFAGGYSDPDIELGHEALVAKDLGNLVLEGRQTPELPKTGFAGKLALLVGGGEGRSPIGHDRITNVLVDDAVARAYLLRHDGEVTIEHLDQRCRGDFLCQRAEPLHVAEIDGHYPAIAGTPGQLRAVNQVLHQLRIDVLAEGFADLFLEPQLPDHHVERFRQPADLVIAGDRELGVVFALLHGLSRRDQRAHRADEP